MAAAYAKPAKTKPHEVKWSVTIDGRPAGAETLKTVNSTTGRLFASGVVEPKSKDGVRIITHQQRDPGGIFKKYRREEKVRLGKGIFAFRKNKSADRIVGLNQKLEPLELAPIGEGPVWDRRAWHTLALWGGSLTGSEGLELTYLDIAERARRQALATPGDSREITNPKKERVSLQMWTLKGLGPEVITTGWLEGAHLVYISNGARELMKEGFSWEPPPPPPPPEPEPAPEEAPDTQAGADQGTPEEGGDAPKEKPQSAAPSEQPEPTPEGEGDDS